MQRDEEGARDSDKHLLLSQDPGFWLQSSPTATLTPRLGLQR